MKTFRYLLGVCVMLLASVSSIYSQNSSIGDLLNIAATKEGEVVEVSGLVTQYVASKTKTTSYYLIKDDFGAFIKVNTSNIRITTNEKFKVNGILYFDIKTKEPFISEQFRILSTGIKVVTNTIVDPNTINDPTTVAAVTGPNVENDSSVESGSGFSNFVKENSTLLIIISFLLVGLIVILSVILRKKTAPALVEKISGIAPGPVSPKHDFSGQANDFHNLTQQDSFSTIKIPQSAPKTMKLIPGELEIMNGPDKGKKFKMVGNSTAQGNIITIGRESQSGENAYSHIELKEKTISRKQAELISKNGNIWVKNLSETNYTRADGKELKPGEQAELKNNSTITIGELELKYNS